MPQDFLPETKVTVGIHRRKFTRKIQIVIRVSLNIMKSTQVFNETLYKNSYLS